MELSSKCHCLKHKEKAEEKINKLSHRLQLAIENSPQFNFEINGWLNNILDNFSKYETMLMNWEDKACLDLECISCKYTKNKKNNKRKSQEHQKNLDSCCLVDNEVSTSETD